MQENGHSHRVETDMQPGSIRDEAEPEWVSIGHACTEVSDLDRHHFAAAKQVSAQPVDEVQVLANGRHSGGAWQEHQLDFHPGQNCPSYVIRWGVSPSHQPA